MVFFYNKILPEIDEVVIAKVENITTFGVEVVLKEYDNIKGFINYSEVSRKKKFKINKILSLNKDILLIVIAVDVEKGYIDLSKRSISDDEIELFNNKNKKYLQIYKIFKYIYFKIKKYDKIENINENDLYCFLQKSLWKILDIYELDILYEKIQKKDINNDIINLIEITELNILPNDIKIILDNYIETKLNISLPCLVKPIKLISYNYDGLNDIKYVLNYKSFNNYKETTYSYNISIHYLSDANYNININQIENSDNNNYNNNDNNDYNDKNLNIKNNIKEIEEVYNYLYEEIKKRASEKKVFF